MVWLLPTSGSTAGFADLLLKRFATWNHKDAHVFFHVL